MKISVSKSEDITPANRFSAFKSILENKYKSQNEHTAERITRAKDETDITLVQGKWLSVRERNVLCKINWKQKRSNNSPKWVILSLSQDDTGMRTHSSPLPLHTLRGTPSSPWAWQRPFPCQTKSWFHQRIVRNKTPVWNAPSWVCLFPRESPMNRHQRMDRFRDCLWHSSRKIRKDCVTLFYVRIWGARYFITKD